MRESSIRHWQSKRLTSVKIENAIAKVPQTFHKALVKEKT